MTPHTRQNESSIELLSALKNRENWICWKVEERNGDTTKTPIKPYSDWDNHPYASSTDSATWRDFETAKAFDESNEYHTDGLGFVFDADDVIVGVDLDDCRDPVTGETADWANNIIELLDTYWEVSPSGTGYHGIGIGLLPGDKTRADIDGESGHIEMYEKGRYFTVTFDHVDECEVDAKPVAEGIQEVYNEYILSNEDDTSGVDGSPAGAKPVDLDDDDLIEKAKVAKNGQQFAALWNGDHSGYESQSEADLALCNHLAFWTGRETTRMDNLFRSSGLMRDKWDDSRGELTYGEMTINSAVRNCSEVYKPQEQSGEGHLYTPIVERQGSYGTWKYDEDDRSWNPITTFTLEVNAFLSDPDSDEMLINCTVVPASNAEKPYDVAIEPSVFNDVRKFKNDVCRGRTTTFSGNYDDLNALRLYVGQKDAPERTGTRKIGMHEDELVTPNGVFGSNWKLDEPKHRYIRTGSTIDTKWKLGDDGDFDSETVARILELLPQTRDPNRWYPVIGWYYAVTVAPWIRDWEGQLPMLMASGDTGCGKTSALGQLYRMMGMDGAPGSAQDTKFALIRALSSTTSIPTWLDEYKPSDMSSYQRDQMQDLLRKATRGGDEARGNADQTVTTYRITSPVVLSGEQELQGAAEERRAIRTQFRKAVTDKGTKTAEAWAKLAGGSYEDASGVHYEVGYDAHEHAKAIHQYVLSLDKDETHEIWKECRQHVYEVLSDEDISGVGDLEQQALQMIKFGMVLYQHFANTVESDLDGIVTNDRIDSAIAHIGAKMGVRNRTSHVDEFLGLLAGAIEDGELIPGSDYEVINAGKDNEQLRIKMVKAHHAVSKYVRDHGLEGYDLLNKANDYKSRMADMVEEKDSYVVGIGVYTRGMNRCVSIDTHRAEEQVDGFVRNSLVS